MWRTNRETPGWIITIAVVLARDYGSLEKTVYVDAGERRDLTGVWEIKLIRLNNNLATQVWRCRSKLAKMVVVKLSRPPRPLAIAPCFINTWLCNSWDHLQHWACMSRCTRLATGHFRSVNIYKLHLKSHCSYIIAVSTGSTTRESSVSAVMVAMPVRRE